MTTSILGLVGNNNPETSHAAARRAVKGTKKGAVKGQILAFLSLNGPLTAKELAHHYQATFDLGVFDIPSADLYDIRRRLSELKRIDGVVEAFGERRNGEDVMRLKETA